MKMSGAAFNTLKRKGLEPHRQARTSPFKGHGEGVSPG